MCSKGTKKGRRTGNRIAQEAIKRPQPKRRPIPYTIHGNVGNIGDINNPRFETIVEKLNIQLPPSEEPLYEAPKPPKTEPTPQPAPQTTTEPEKKGKGWKFWLGIALAGVAAAGVGTYMFNNKK